MSGRKRAKVAVHPSVLKKFVDIEEEPDSAVMAALTKGRFGEVASTLGNALCILEHDPHWAGRVKWDLHSGVVEIDGRHLIDNDESEAAVWIERRYGVAMASRKVGEALATLAHRNEYHPIVDYLDGLTWDGVPRVGQWVRTYLGCRQGALAERLGRIWMIQACARAYEPGCQAKSMLILAGRTQNSGKSKALRLLAGEKWFSETPPDMYSKDRFGALQGVWIYEIPELAGIQGAMASRVKAYISAQTDKFRSPFGRNDQRHPRGVVFAGTTNDDVFLEDPTGSCRFWPISVADVIDCVGIERDRDQLWAEARELYKSGEQWWLTREESEGLRAHSDRYQDCHPWQSTVEAYAAGKGFVGVAEALGYLNVPAAQQRGQTRELRKVFTAMGWRPGRCRVDGVQMRGFVPPA